MGASQHKGGSRRTIEVLVVANGLALGGTETHLASVLPELDTERFRVSVFLLRPSTALVPELRAAGVKVYAPRARLGGRFLSLLTRWLERVWLLATRRPTLVHCFLPEAYLVGMTAALMVGPRRRIMSRRSLNDYQASHRAAAWLEQRLHRFAAAMIGNSRAVADQLAGETTETTKVGVIYNGIAPRFLADLASRDEARARLDLPNDALVLVKVANFFPYKGHLDLIDALGRASGSMPPDWRLVCVGRDAGDLATVQARAGALGIGGNLVWLGERHDVAMVLAAADIGLLCSHQEGFPNVVLEGMAAGLPMIATTVGGVPEIVSSPEFGLLVPPRDPAALAAAILRYAGDPGLRRAVGKAGRDHVVGTFSMQQCVRGYERLYTAIAADRTEPVQSIIDGAGDVVVARHADRGGRTVEVAVHHS